MARKGSTTQRGYGHRHQLLRAQWAPKVERGGVDCARCGRSILPGSAWQLGHSDQDRSQYNGPEHRYCNEAAGGRNGAAVTNAMRGTPLRHSRSW